MMDFDFKKLIPKGAIRMNHIDYGVACEKEGIYYTTDNRGRLSRMGRAYLSAPPSWAKDRSKKIIMITNYVEIYEDQRSGFSRSPTIGVIYNVDGTTTTVNGFNEDEDVKPAPCDFATWVKRRINILIN